jgi:PAS domain S-box-containing protein
MRHQSLFEEIFREFPVPTIILQADAPDFTILEVNDLFLSLSGASREALMGKGFFQSYPHPAMYSEESVDMVRRSLNELLRDKKIVRSDIQKYTQNPVNDQHSHIFYLQATNRPVLDEGKKIKYIIRSLKDVTETVSTQNKEQEIHQVLRANERFLQETQAVGKIGSWEIDRDYKVTWSDIHYQIFETEEGFQPTVENSLVFIKDEKDRDRFREFFQGTITNDDHFDEELEIITAKGNLRWLRFVGKGEDRDGELVRIYGIAQDVTAHKILDLQLTHSRNQYLGLIQTMQGIVWEADLKTLEMSFVSEQITHILGYSQEECLNQPRFWQNHLHPKNKEEVIRHTLNQLQSRSHFSHDYRIMKKDGSYVWLRTSFSIINESDGSTRVRGLMVDVTATKLLTDLDHLEKTVLEMNSMAGISLEEVLKTYLEGISELFPEMHCGLMRIKNGRMFNWVSVCLPPIYEEAIEGLPIGERAGSCGTAAFRREMVVVSDIANDPLWAGYEGFALKENLRSCWSYPIISSSGEVMATLGMYYTTIKAPSEEELKVVERTASILKVIIEHNFNTDLLEEANFLMKQSQELAHFGSLQWDIRANKLTWSKELYVIFGIDPDTDITQEGHFEWVHPEDRLRVKQEVDYLLSSKEDQIFEERIIRPNGEVRHLKTWVRVKCNEQGEPIKIIGTCLDITESKKTEERLVSSEQRLRNILNSQTNYVIRMDLDFKYTYTNKKFFDDFAFDKEESLLGLNSLRTVKEEQKQEVTDVINKCIAYPNRVFAMELEKITAGGQSKSTIWHFICLTDSNGRPYEIQGIGIDISDQKKAEQERELKSLELKESEKRYSDLFHLSPQPMYLFDIESLKFLDVNDAAIKQYGYNREEFLSMTIKDIKSQDEKSRLVEEMILAKQNNVDFYRAIFTHLTKEGEVIHVDLHSNLIPYQDRSVRLVLASNITDSMEYLKTLEVQNKKLTEIAWTQSHVVRAPLARIMALIDMIKNYPELNEENQELLGYIFTSAVELDEVIREISRKAEAVSFESKD